MQKIISSILLMSIISFAVAFFLRNLIGTESKKIKDKIIYFLSFVFLLSVAQAIISENLNITIYITAFICLLFNIMYFKLKFLNSLIITMVVISTIILVDILTGITMMMFGIDINVVKESLLYQLSINLFSSTLLILMSYIVRKIKYVRFLVQRDTGSSFTFFIAPIFVSTLFGLSIPTIVSSNEQKHQYIYLTVCIATLLCLYIFSFVMTYLNHNSAFKDYELKTKTEEIEKMKIYNRIIEDLYTEIRQFKHDYKNVISSIDGYLSEDKYEDLKKYFYKNLISERENINKLDVMINLNKIEIPSLKGVISSKFKLLQDNHIDFKIDIPENIEESPIDDFDLCKIIGILIDNAIEATCETNVREISFGVIKVEDSMIFVISNTFNEEDKTPIHKMFEKEFSTKGKNRGIGLYFVRNLIDKKYKNILLNTFIEKNVFTQEMNIKINK